MNELLSILAASVTAVGTIMIAQGANTISKKANDISERATKLEADKHLVEWGQRVLTCTSSLVALRTLTKNNIDKDDFTQRRRELRANLFALRDEGQLFFRFGGKPSDADAPTALKAIHELTELSGGKVFTLPDKYEKEAVETMRVCVRAFIQDIQARVDNHWTRQAGVGPQQPQQQDEVK